MRCPECGSEINENEVFCSTCGAEILAVPDNDAAEQDSSDENVKQGSRKNKKQKKTGNDRSNKTVLAVRIAAAVVLVLIIVIIIVWAVNTFKASEGRRIFDKVPLGRNAEMINSETQAEFLKGEISAYGALNYIADYDYICESEKRADVSGIQLPEWAVLLREDGFGNIGEAMLYNFSILKHNWMGEKTAARIEVSSVQFGMKLKEAERAVGLKPYTIVKENKDNIVKYAYRYHYTDEATGNNCVMNFYIVINDANGQVENVYDEQLDYLNLIFKGSAG